MFLHHIKLKDFRNYSDLDFSFYKNKVFISGDNAQGKTNFLESIFVLAFTNSYRTHDETELIRWNTKNTYINGHVEKIYGNNNITLVIHNNGKKIIKFNNNYCKKISDFLGKINVVSFSSIDLQLIKGNPEIRRKYLNRILIQIFPEYYQIIQQYNRILNQRNVLLKKIQESKNKMDFEDQLEAWDIQLVEFGTPILLKRKIVLEELQTLVNFYQKKISGNIEDDVWIKYLSNIDFSYIEHTYCMKDLKNIFFQKLKGVKNREIKLGQTIIGPHRDDFKIFLNGKETKNFASSGEQKSIVLSLKLAELNYLTTQKGESPIFLIDDVLSELDEKRQSLLFSSLPNSVHTFITMTDFKDFYKEFEKDGEFLVVNSGTINKYNKH